MKELNLELGRYYRTLRGRTVLIVSVVESENIFIGKLIPSLPSYEVIVHYFPDGRMRSPEIFKNYGLTIKEELSTNCVPADVKPGDKLKLEVEIQKIASTGTIQCSNDVNIPLRRFDEMVKEYKPVPEFNFERDLKPGMRFHYIKDFVTFCYKKEGSDQYIFYDEKQGILRNFTLPFMESYLKFYEMDWID